jgi:transcription termination factor Rho
MGILNQLKKQDIATIRQLWEEGFSKPAGYRATHSQMVCDIVQKALQDGDKVDAEGILEMMQGGFGFIRSYHESYAPSDTDVYVSPSQAKKFNLCTGDAISGMLRAPSGGERYFSFSSIESLNEQSCSKIAYRNTFDSLTPLHPNQRLTLEYGNGTNEDILLRVMDLITPIGKGQRGLIIAPPKAGKTVLSQFVAKSLIKNHPDCHVMVLLIDERPEEVTEMRQLVGASSAEVIASTFDEPPTRHVQVSEMTLERAKRLVEQGKDVVILLDSITKLARAYNTVTPSSGKLLTGGLDANALHRPKRFFGAARNLKEGGSLTILATALVETGSKMDDVIFEEFKGTGNMDLCLSRKIANFGLYPAIDLLRSGTRRDDLLLGDNDWHRIYMLRRLLNTMDEVKAIEFLLGKMRHTDTNAAFLDTMKDG